MPLLEPGTWNLEPGTWNLEPGTHLRYLLLRRLADTEVKESYGGQRMLRRAKPGTLNLEPGTWNMKL